MTKSKTANGYSSEVRARANKKGARYIVGINDLLAAAELSEDQLQRMGETMIKC